MNVGQSPHLWLGLSPHGFGHAAMTAPVIQAVRRHHPDLRLTVQTSVAPDFLASRYKPPFTLIPDIPDFGLVMRSSTEIDLEATAARYRAMLERWDELADHEAERLSRDRPDLLLANCPPLLLEAAHRAGVPCLALSSLQWLDIYRHYLGNRPEAGEVLAHMDQAYHRAQAFLRVTPAMDMPGLRNVREIGPVGWAGTPNRALLESRLGLVPRGQVGLVAFGGIDHALDMTLWPHLDGWTWLTSLPLDRPRPDLHRWDSVGMSFSDLLASVDVVVTKPGYGTYVEAALSGIPVLTLERPGWPECPHMELWLARHAKVRVTSLDGLLGEGLRNQLQKLFIMPEQRVALPTGNEEAATAIVSSFHGIPL